MLAEVWLIICWADTSANKIKWIEHTKYKDRAWAIAERYGSVYDLPATVRHINFKEK